MNKTKIEWCDMTFNPVTGCLHGCEYCYARRIAERYGGSVSADSFDGRKLVELNEQQLAERKNGKVSAAPFPVGFRPTFLKYRLWEPAHAKKPQTIFVCSMADLFGEWVPDEWIEAVFEACEKAPQHRYLFLTKNPARYMKLAEAGMLPEEENFWYGSSTPTADDDAFYSDKHNTFLSVEPILGDFDWMRDCVSRGFADWIILGAMTGPGSRRHTPKLETIENILASVDVAVFMKDSLVPIVGEENMRRELPWRW